MCGIAGFTFDGRPDPSLRLDRMLESMHARGPDGEGRFVDDRVALGMRRLAIIDPDHGRQPFTTDDGQIVVVVNGEIYNHRDLRRELAARGTVFRTECDAEVLPHAFRAWGADRFVGRLDGMFAIAVLDRREQQLHLYRDRYGEKPLIYKEDGGGFRFASQLSTIALDGGGEIDAMSLRHYLALHFVPGSHTILRGVRRLLPGHHLVVDLARRRPIVTRPWLESVGPTSPRVHVPRTYAGAVRTVRRLVSESVESRLIADVPVGVFLSGGLDSSAVAAAASRVGRISTFSVGFQNTELDESAHARAVAQALASDHHHYQFDITSCLSVFDEAIAALDEPVGDPACLPAYLLSREASQRVKVVLTGEGADELFGGYSYYPELNGASVPVAGWRLRLKQLITLTRARRSLPATLDAFFRHDNTTPSGFPLLTTAAERSALVPRTDGDEDEWSGEVAAELSRIESPLARAQVADLRSWLPDDLLVKLDRMTMAWSLEGRAPYLEPRLAELALALPDAWKGGENRRKRVLRDAVAPWLPPGIVDRAKQGFVLPMQSWLLGPLRDRLLDQLQGDHEDGLDLRIARRIAIDDLARGATRSRLLYGLLAYRAWSDRLREARSAQNSFADRVPSISSISGSREASQGRDGST